MQYIKKSILFICHLLSLILIPNICFSQDFESGTFYFDIHYYAYTEPGLMSEKSRLPSLSVGYQKLTSLIKKESTVNVGGFVEASLGLTRYDGSGSADTSYTKFLTEIYLSGYKSFYTGLGYRRLLDPSGGSVTSTGAYGYDRLSQYTFIPVGSIFYIKDSGRFRAQYNHFIQGTQKSYLSQGGQYQDVTNNQNSGYGLDLSYTAKNNRWEGYFRYWNIDKSNEEIVYRVNGSRYGTGWEPHNNTIEIGYRHSF
jgi:hypothetical protein